MMRVLGNNELKQMNKEILAWFEKELKGKNSTYIYNLLLMIKHLVEDLRRK